nr:hypothetical protein [Methylomarinum sp. Ch1-1]MDP4521260.1 hypothetical protein [Methylomarinum sp. Ch1-1]
MKINLLDDQQTSLWDDYVENSTEASFFIKPVGGKSFGIHSAIRVIICMPSGRAT